MTNQVVTLIGRRRYINSYALPEAVIVPDPVVPIGAMSHLSCGFVLTFMQLQTPRRCHPRTCSPTLHTIGLVLLLNLAKPSCFLLDPSRPPSSEHWVREAEVPEGCGVGFGVEAVQLGRLSPRKVAGWDLASKPCS